MILKFELSVDETNLLLSLLGEAPLKVSMGLWAKLKQSADEQMAPPKEPAKA